MFLSIFWAGLKNVVWDLVSLSALTQGSVWNPNPLQMNTQTTVLCVQAEDSGLLGPVQSPNWVKACLVSTVFFLPVSIELGVEKCLGLSVDDRVLCLQSLTVDFCKSVCSFISCQSHRHWRDTKTWAVSWAREECRPRIIWSGSGSGPGPAFLVCFCVLLCQYLSAWCPITHQCPLQLHARLNSFFLFLLRSLAISLGFPILGEICAYVTIFNPTTEVVTLYLHGWYMVGVFLLPAFTSLRHECQDLLSPCDGMHACTD